MTMHDYVESLRSKHAHLEQQIDDELHRPLPDQSILTRLKREKLRIKDEIARLGSTRATTVVASGEIHYAERHPKRSRRSARREVIAPLLAWERRCDSGAGQRPSEQTARREIAHQRAGAEGPGRDPVA